MSLYQEIIDLPTVVLLSYSVLSDDGRARVAVGEMVKKQKLLLPGGRFCPSFI